MEISDRTENSVIADVHPLLANEVLKLSNGDKTRIIWISPYVAIVRNKFGWETF